MTQTLTVTEAKARLSELVAAVANTHDHIEITRNGEPAAAAAYTFITERLTANPHRVGGELQGPYEGMRSAHLGPYRVVYRIDDAAHTVTVVAVRLRATWPFRQTQRRSEAH